MIGTVIAPGLGIMLSLFTPAPLILLYLQHGKSAGLISVGAVVILLAWMVGMEAAMGFAAAYALVVILLAEGIRFQLAPEKTIGVAALSATVLSGVLLWMAVSGEDQSLLTFFESQLQVSANEYLKALKEAGTPEDELQFMQGVAERYTPMMARALFAVLAVGSLITAVLNYVLVRALWLRFYPRSYFQDAAPNQWMLPDPMVWGFIASAAALFLGEGALTLVGMNVFIVMLALYFFQGLAIASSILSAKRAHPAIAVLVYLLVFTQPLLMGLVIGLGLFDVWIDFRKIRPQAGQPEEDRDPDDYEN